jgi:lipid II:glycine glycyltransferase (peptidoglycan interpeptide bridge formation enzyme)
MALLQKEVTCNMAKKISGYAPYLEYSLDYAFAFPQLFTQFGLHVRLAHTYVLDLRMSLDNIYISMSKKRRNDIRSAMKKGIEVRDGTVKEILELVKTTYKRKNMLPPYSMETYQLYLAGAYGINSAKSLVAVSRLGAVATACIFYDSRRAYYMIGGVSDRIVCRGAESLLLWNLIKYAKEELELEEFDFEGSMNPGVGFFMSQFGGAKIQKYIIYRPGLFHYLVKAVLWSKSHTRASST